MRVIHRAEGLDTRPFAFTEPGRGPLADIVDGQQRRLVERADEIGAGGVRGMVLHIMEPRIAATEAAHVTDVPCVVDYFVARVGGGVEGAARDLPHPVRETPRHAVAGLHVAADMVDVAQRQARGLKAIGDRLAGRTPLVFDARQTLFSDPGDELAVADQRGSGIVGVSPDPQNVHVPSAARCHYTQAASGGHIHGVSGNGPVPWPTQAERWIPPRASEIPARIATIELTAPCHGCRPKSRPPPASIGTAFHPGPSGRELPRRATETPAGPRAPRSGLAHHTYARVSHSR